ncbi:MAG: 6-phosphogluconate dehydrogenase NAD-binding protein [Caulobacter sp.]|nr:6-phosphogluconate dehydrogenase NAD-binding protein [Caulobacter sp.]
MNVGWIGLGMMGLGMASCAARAGHRVVGHSRGNPDHAALKAAGGGLDADARAVAAGCEVLCINVFTDDQVRDVLYGQGVLESLSPGAVLAIHTTGDPAVARDAQAAAPEGVSVLDAAFSGTPAQAAAGELAIMAGGEAGAYAKALPVLASYGRLVRHVGPLGAGQRLKLINNMLFAAHVRLAAEGYSLAERQGFDAEMTAEVLAACSASSRALAIIGDGGRVAENLARMRFYLDKDMEVARRLAAESGLDLGLIGEITDGFRPDKPA